MMQHTLAVLCICFGCCAAPVPCAQHPAINDVVARYRELALRRLVDADPDVASQALDALATLERPAYTKKLLAKLECDLSDPALRVALEQFVSSPEGADLERARLIVQEAVRKGEEERREEPQLVNAAEIEFLAVEVLLASKEPDSIAFAMRHLQETLDQGWTTWRVRLTFALDLVGRRRIRALAEELSSAVEGHQMNAEVEPDLHHSILSALAKNGNEAAIQMLKKRFATHGEDLRILSDGQLMDILDITVDELVSIDSDAGTMARIYIAAQLARRGRLAELCQVTIQVLENPTPQASVLLAQQLGQVGDVSFVKSLDALASMDAIGQLHAARCIFEIIAREGAAK